MNSCPTLQTPLDWLMFIGGVVIAAVITFLVVRHFRVKGFLVMLVLMTGMAFWVQSLLVSNGCII